MLTDMTVVDISQQLPGPYASALLRQLGARVIKVEPKQGDPSRSLDPHMFALVNAGKEIVKLDLKTSGGVEALHDAVSGADVFIEGFRPGVAARLGASWPVLSALNPRLIYCSISGTGQDGPYARTPMHDLNLQGLAGLDPGAGIGVPWVDLGTGTSVSLAIVASWHKATITGEGTYLDAAMLDTAVLWGRVKASAHGRTEPTYGIFTTADGLQIAIAILEDHIWTRLCQALGWDDWLQAPDLERYADRVAASTMIHERLLETCLTLRADELMALAQQHDLPLTPAGRSPGTVATAQLRARELDADSQRRLPLPFEAPHAAASPRSRSSQ